MGWTVSLVRFITLRRWTLFTVSRWTLKDRGTSWVRLGVNGPGLRVYDVNAGPMLPFSIRNRHQGSLRIGRFAFCFMPAVGRWP